MGKHEQRRRSLSNHDKYATTHELRVDMLVPQRSSLGSPVDLYAWQLCGCLSLQSCSRHAGRKVKSVYPTDTTDASSIASITAFVLIVALQTTAWPKRPWGAAAPRPPSQRAWQQGPTDEDSPPATTVRHHRPYRHCHHRPRLLHSPFPSSPPPSRLLQAHLQRMTLLGL